MKHYLIFFIVLTLIFPLFLVAEELPDIKEGLWKVETTSDGKPMGVIKQCVSQAFLAQMLSSSSQIAGGRCSKMELEKQGSKYISSANCEIGPMKMTSRSEISGDFQNSYTTVTDVKMIPAMMGREKTRSVAKASYLGKCPAGMNPGDMITPDGRKVSFADMMKMAEEMPDIGKMMQDMPDR